MTVVPDRISMVVAADDVPGPGQGRWTCKDYAALPDDGKRYEIVEGVLFMAPSPGRWHQESVGEVFTHLRNYVKLAGIGTVYMAPFEVELAFDTVVQPDVLVVLNDHRDIITDSRIIGAPDLVVEVASPGTAGYDRRKKQNAYAHAGVPEYWIIDPISRAVEVLALEFGEYHPIGVFQGKATLPSRVLPGFPARVEQFFM
jgi:Uma2 family endonuclease